jgi:hypothetical protein
MIQVMVGGQGESLRSRTGMSLYTPKHVFPMTQLNHLVAKYPGYLGFNRSRLWSILSNTGNAEHIKYLLELAHEALAGSSNSSFISKNPKNPVVENQ